MSEAGPAPRGDAFGALFWIVLGAAITVGAWRMDRLERFQIRPYEVPGLVPGLLGIVIALLGLALLVRAWRRGAAAAASAGPQAATEPPQPATLPLALALTLGYALLLVGRGLPFWAATAVFVAAFVVLLDGPRQRALGRAAAAIAVRAVGFGLVVGAVVTLAFERLFLVRLP